MRARSVLARELVDLGRDDEHGPLQCPERIEELRIAQSLCRVATRVDDEHDQLELLALVKVPEQLSLCGRGASCRSRGKGQQTRLASECDPNVQCRDLRFVLSSYLSRFESDLDDREFKRLTRSVAF